MTAPARAPTSPPRRLPRAVVEARGLAEFEVFVSAAIEPGSELEADLLRELAEAQELAEPEPAPHARATRSDRRLSLSSGRIAKLWTGRRRRRARRSLTLAAELTGRRLAGPGALAAAQSASAGLLLMDDVGGRLIEALANAEGFARELAEAFAELHRRGVYHGDAKRSNLRVAGEAGPLSIDTLILLDIDGLRLDPLLSDRAAGKDLGMLLSSLGGWIGAEGRERLVRDYLERRCIGPLRAYAIRRRALAIVHRRAARGSTPSHGGWLGEDPVARLEEASGDEPGGDR